MSLPQGYEAIFVYGNLAEAMIWFGFSLRYWLKSKQGRPLQANLQRQIWKQQICRWISVDFLAFGVSDLVEIDTQAWWRPWWLLLWKASCIAGLVWLGWQWYRVKL